jgi:peptidoglycan-associated lipoprotein
LCCGAFVVSGCAKKDLVKQEEPISVAPAVKTPVVDDTAAREKAAREAAAKEAAAVPAKAATESTVVTEVPKDVQPAAVEQGLAAIYFDFDSPALSAEARATLAKNAEFLAKKSGVKAKIEGHCDERGSDEYNLALGERRAKAALDYLVTMGIQRDRLAPISYGKEKPVDPGHDEAAWAKNRRAEFIIVK